MPQYQIPLDRTANELITEGPHLFTIINHSEGEGDAGPYWRFDCASSTPGEEGKTATLFLSLSPQSRWKVELFLDAVGAPEKGVATIDKFLGRSFKGQVEHGMYKGRKQANITEMFSAQKTGSGPVAAQPVVMSVETVKPEVKELPGRKA